MQTPLHKIMNSMFSIILNVKNRNVIGQINSAAEFVEHLKNEKREEVSEILKLREIKEKNNDYQAIKMSLPSICFNYTFKNNYINADNADESTGYLYFDIDGEKDFDYDTTYVTALWRSVGGNGFGLLVKVKNLLKENFKESYEYIVNILDIPYDKACNDCSRINIISFDTEAYYNEYADEIDLMEFNATIVNELIKLPHSNNNKINNLGYSHNGGGNIRFNNLSDVLAEKDFKFNDEGYYDFGKNKIEYCKCYTPYKIIPEGFRNQKLVAYAYCIISINPTASFTMFKRYLQKYNEKCRPPLEMEEIDEIATKVYNLRGKIEPNNKAKKRIIYSDNIKTLSEKLKINGKILGNERSEKTFNELLNFVLNWDYEKHPKITQKKLKELTGKNKKTIEKYYRSILNTIKGFKN